MEQRRGFIGRGGGGRAFLLGAMAVVCAIGLTAAEFRETIMKLRTDTIYPADGSTVTVSGALTVSGATTESGAKTMAGDLTLDDGSGASPSVTFTDGSDETAVFTKAAGANLSITIGTTDSLQVLTGNLRVGNGTPDQTIDGEDQYLEGLLEADGVIYADGGINIGGYVPAMGTHEFRDAATTTDTVTVAGTDSDDVVLVTINESGSSTLYVKSAVPGSGNFVVTLDQDPGTTLTLGYTVWQD